MTRRGALLLAAIAVAALAADGLAEDEVPTIREGAVGLRFEGARAMRPSRLAGVIEAEVRGFVDAGFDEVYAADAADALLRFYFREGHAKADVEYVSTREEAKRGLLRFAVREGPRIRLGTVTFEGHTAFPDELMQQFVSRGGGLTGSGVYIAERLRGDLGDIESYYAERGWLRAEVVAGEPTLEGTDEEATAHFVVTVREGPRTFLDPEVRFSGNEKLPLATLLRLSREVLEEATLPDGRIPYRPMLRHRLQSVLLEEYGVRGHAFVRVIVRAEISASGEVAVLRAEIDEGPRGRVRVIEIEGNTNVPNHMILRELGFDREADPRTRGTLDIGDEFDVRRVRNAQRALLDLGLFRTVRIDPEPLGDDEEGLALRVRVREREPRSVDLRAGWGSYELLRVGAVARHNAWNGIGELLGTRWWPYALETRLSAEASTKNARLGFRLRDRRFLLTRIESVLDTSAEVREEVSFSFRRVGAVLGFSRPLLEWDRHLRVEAAWSYSVTDTFQVSGALDPSLENVSNVSSLSIGLLGEWRKDPVWPASGGYFSVRASWPTATSAAI
jgi:outer membrane protein assembly factor BamA